ncbi:disease resistance protein RGA5 [Aegilops tauschii subsp. strangulata]|uniref:Disease resistance protein RPP13 n=4 Tax=Aegilops tauschii TaxID=37682 RepID=A0A453T544_AEGTS|nr:disease resistance protein RGA5 [Aegilops tauschii subsp. strangulata]
MEVAVVASAVTGAIRTLLPKLTALLHKKYKLSGGVRKKITSLRHEMSSMSALLVTLAGLEELTPRDKDWRDKVRELSYDIEDCIDIFTHELDRHEAKGGLRRRLKKIKARYKIGHRIEELRAQVVELSNRHNRYKPDECIGSPSSRALVEVDPRLQALYVDPDSLVGIDAQKAKLIELLRMDVGDTQRLKLVAIAGFGGMGKTTLANQVYTKMKGQFDCTAFVSVSRIPNIAKILSDIYSATTDPNTNCNDERLIIDRLRNSLEDKRYLIVIDDIWTMEAWNAIKGCFLENSLGSRVITTTRFEDIAQACCSSLHGLVYRIKPLNCIDSRRLFDRRIFPLNCPEQLKTVRGGILKKCEGVPLVIISVASILACHEEVNSTEIWEKIHNHFVIYLEGHRALGWIRHVLNLGYNDLCLDLKTCMLYFSIFAEDSEIMKDDLVKRWIAEGFVTEKHGRSPHDIAESYFSELINRNMIQIANIDDCGHVLSCRVHDIMLDFIILKSTEENFVTIMNDLHCTKGCLDVRRLSLQKIKNSRCNDLVENIALTQARSFNFWGPAQSIPSVSKFQLLRVLHIVVSGDRDENYDLSCICNLFQLKYLRIVGIWCTGFLKQLRKLQHLQTLEIAHRRSEDVYLDIGELPLTLLHLIVFAKLLGDIGRMRSLICLATLAIGDIKHMEGMKGLGNLADLRELRLYVSASVWNTGGRQLSFRESLAKPEHHYVPHLRGVAICDSLLSSFSRLGSLESLIINGGLPVDVLICWSPPPRRLRRLHVQDCPFSVVPYWITQFAILRSLEIEILSMTREGIHILSQLVSLVNLRLFVRKSLPAEGVVIPGAAFPNLKGFFFRCKVPCLKFRAGATPRLQNLTVECHTRAVQRADTVLEGIEHLGSLMTCKVNIYHHDFFMATQTGGGDGPRPPSIWQALEDEVLKAINKNLGYPEPEVLVQCL